MVYMPVIQMMAKVHKMCHGSNTSLFCGCKPPHYVNKLLQIGIIFVSFPDIEFIGVFRNCVVLPLMGKKLDMKQAKRGVKIRCYPNSITKIKITI